MKPVIYLDYAATTPVDSRVAHEMLLCLTLEGVFGNAASQHKYGLTARESIEKSRSEVAELIAADPSEVIFTSGATEANNLALKGAAQLYQGKGKHIITIKTEHPAVLDCCQQLEKNGFQVTYLSPTKTGLVDLEALSTAIRSDTILVSIMHVNNETGVCQDLRSIAEITSQKNILLHVDAAQSLGKVPINLQNLPIDLMSFSAHKLYGPKGIGALYLRKKPRVRVAAQVHGGGQEQGMRSGTLPTHQIVGMGAACRIAKQEMEMNQIKIQGLHSQFLSGIQNKLQRNHSDEHGIPNILNIAFKNILARDLMAALPDVAFSVGSACLSKGTEPSYVLRAMGLNVLEANQGVRFSFGHLTTSDEIDFVIKRLQAVIPQL